MAGLAFIKRPTTSLDKERIRKWGMAGTGSGQRTFFMSLAGTLATEVLDYSFLALWLLSEGVSKELCDFVPDRLLHPRAIE